MFINFAANGEGCGGAIVDRGFKYSIKGVESPAGKIG
jgi:hypothetical protein